MFRHNIAQKLDLELSLPEGARLFKVPNGPQGNYSPGFQTDLIAIIERPSYEVDDYDSYTNKYYTYMQPNCIVYYAENGEWVKSVNTFTPDYLMDSCGWTEIVSPFKYKAKESK